MDNPEKMAGYTRRRGNQRWAIQKKLQGTQDEGAIKDRQSRENGSIGYTRPRAILVSDWLMLKKSSLKLLGQMEPNLAGSIYVRSSIKLLRLVPFGQQTWLLLLKIEHMVKLHVLG
jgi:hypothetical protein